MSVLRRRGLLKKQVSSKFLFITISFFSISFFAFAEPILVFEFEVPGEKVPHIDLVASVACSDPNLECDFAYLESYEAESLQQLRRSIQDARVVNMSFGFEEPKIKGAPRPDEDFDFDKQRADYIKLKDELHGIINAYPNVLFSAAAGNGSSEDPGLPGLPLGYQNMMFPAVYDSENILSVGAIATDKIEVTKLDDYKYAPYSNFSLFEVDIVTNVEKGRDGKLLVGTSFSAPVAAKIAARIRQKHQSLTAVQVKEILIKSSYVQKIDKAIEASRDWLENGRSSTVFKAHTAYRKIQRDSWIQGLGGIMLAKSGGPLVEDVAYQCADNYGKALGLLSITQACLQAHEDRLFTSKEQLDKMKELWSLRGI